MRQNTGGEFPPGSGMKWLGVQFNASDILGNVYAGKKQLPNGKTKTVRIYCGRWKEMVPCLEKIATKLGEALVDPQYKDYAKTWDLPQKWERAKQQLAIYRSKVSMDEEKKGLLRLKVEPKKSKRLSKTFVKREYTIPKTKHEKLFGLGESGKLVGIKRKASYLETSHLFDFSEPPMKRQCLRDLTDLSEAYHTSFIDSPPVFDFAPQDSWTNEEPFNMQDLDTNYVVPKGLTGNSFNLQNNDLYGPLEALHQLLGGSGYGHAPSDLPPINLGFDLSKPPLAPGFEVPKFERQPSIEDLLASDDDLNGDRDFLTTESDNEEARNREESQRMIEEKQSDPWGLKDEQYMCQCEMVNEMISTYLDKISDTERSELEYLKIKYSYPMYILPPTEYTYLNVSPTNFNFIATQLGNVLNDELDESYNYYAHKDRLAYPRTTLGFMFLRELKGQISWFLNSHWIPIDSTQIQYQQTIGEAQ